jgi:putative addiction module component (TIGR02574 family)
MTQIAEKLRNKLLQLPTEDRAELAYCLIRSLDDDDDVDIQAAWEVELESRWQKMESGEIIGIPAEKVFAKLQKKYS